MKIEYECVSPWDYIKHTYTVEKFKKVFSEANIFQAFADNEQADYLMLVAGGETYKLRKIDE
jgi:hypothetical protein